LAAEGGFGFAAGGGFGLPREPPGEAAGAPGAGVPAGPLPVACPGAFHERAARAKALKRRVRNVFIRVDFLHRGLGIGCAKIPVGARVLDFKQLAIDAPPLPLAFCV